MLRSDPKTWMKAWSRLASIPASAIMATSRLSMRWINRLLMQSQESKLSAGITMDLTSKTSAGYAGVTEDRKSIWA